MATKSPATKFSNEPWNVLKEGGVFVFAFKEKSPTVKLIPFSPFIRPLVALVDHEHATLDAVARALLSKDEIDKRPASLNKHIKHALSNNPSAKGMVTRATEGGWENIGSIDNEIFEYLINPETLANILMIVSGFYSEKTIGEDKQKTEGYEEICTDLTLLVRMLISPQMAKERKVGWFTAGTPLRTALGQLEKIPQLIFGLYTPDDLSVDDQQILEQFCKFKEIDQAIQVTKDKVKKLDWIHENYRKTEAQMQSYLKLPDGQSVNEFIVNTPQEKLILRLKVEWQESEKKKGRDTTLPFPPNLNDLIESSPLDETNEITLGDIEGNSAEVKVIFKRQLGTGVLQNNSDLIGVKAVLFNQLVAYFKRVTETVATRSEIFCRGEFHPLRSVQQLAHQKIIMEADHNTGAAGPATTIVLSQEWKLHPSARTIINWLYAVQVKAMETKDKFGFYLAIQPITREIGDYWMSLLDLSTGCINEVLGGILSEIPYIKEDLLYIIAKAWMNVEAMQGRDTFDGALRIQRTYSTLIAEPMAAPPIPAQGGDDDETCSDDDEEPNDDAADAAAAAAGRAAAGPAAAADPQPQNKKRKGPPGPPQSIVEAVYKVVTGNKKKPAGMTLEIKTQIEALLNRVDVDDWADFPEGPDMDERLGNLKDKFGLPEMYINAITKHGTITVLAYYASYLAAEIMGISEDQRKSLTKDSLVKKFG